MAIPGPSTFFRSGRMFSITGTTQVGRTSSRWTRLKASSCAVSRAPRSDAASAFSA